VLYSLVPVLQMSFSELCIRFFYIILLIKVSAYNFNETGVILKENYEEPQPLVSDSSTKFNNTFVNSGRVSIFDQPSYEKKFQKCKQQFMQGLQLLKKKFINEGLRILTELAEAKNYIPASEFLAQEYLFGTILEQNISKAIFLLSSLATKGSCRAQLLLGFCYSNGIGVRVDIEKAIIYYHLAALAGDIYATMIMGYRYKFGLNVEENCELSLKFYRRVADKVALDIKEKTIKLYEQVRIADKMEKIKLGESHDDEIIQYYLYQADLGDVSSQVIIGRLFYYGSHGVDVNYEKAFEYFQKAAQLGNTQAKAFLGEMYLWGHGVLQDNKTALKFFEESVMENDPTGLNNLGLMYLHGIEVKQDLNRAYELFTSSEKQGHPQAQLNLGLMHYNGFGTSKNIPRALNLLQKSALSGNILAQYNIAAILQEEKVPFSCQLTSVYYKSVCEKGTWSRLFEEALKAYERKEYLLAMTRYLFLAELGYEVAQHNVAHILDSGITTFLAPYIESKYALTSWFRLAIQENPIAHLKIGDYFYYGKGVPVNYKKAAFYYQLAASNNAQAMFNIGYMYEHGIGRPLDYHLAKRYYDMVLEIEPKAYAVIFIPRIILQIKLYFSEQVFKKYGFQRKQKQENYEKPKLVGGMVDEKKLNDLLGYVFKAAVGLDVDVDYIWITLLVLSLTLLIRVRQILFR
jgi:SEL1 protein